MSTIRFKCVAGSWLLLLSTVLPQVRAQNSSVENIQRVGSLLSDKNGPVGSCFLIDTRGYVATCLSNLNQVNKEISVVFPGNRRLRVLGFLAASRAKDVAILKLADLDENSDWLRESLDLR